MPTDQPFSRARRRNVSFLALGHSRVDTSIAHEPVSPVRCLALIRWKLLPFPPTAALCFRHRQPLLTCIGLPNDSRNSFSLSRKPSISRHSPQQGQASSSVVK